MISLGLRKDVSKRDDVTTRLLHSFKELIAEGAIGPGLKLLPERTLAQKFGVSRSSLRHALKVLESMGVLVQRVGDGTYINSDASAILAQPTEFLILMAGIRPEQICDARLIVEPELAARAAEHRTADHIDALHRALILMQREPCPLAELAQQDLAFHETIFRAAGNLVCELIFAVLHRAILNAMLRTNGLTDTKQLGNVQHEAIFLAIRNRKPREARRRMVEHITSARDFLVRLEKLQSEAALAERITRIDRDLLPTKPIDD